MRYYYEKPERYRTMYGITYTCNHPVYDRCTLFKIGKRGLAVIQQRYCHRTKHTHWTEIDPWLIDTIYLHPKFKTYFDDRSSEMNDSLYPTRTMGDLFRSKGNLIRENYILSYEKGVA